MTDLKNYLQVLELEPIGPGRYLAQNFDEGHGIVFGGQLLGQTIVAAAADVEGKEVKSLHTIFARSARGDAPIEVEVEQMHSGRAFGSVTVTMSQDGKICTRSLVLLHAPDEDLIRYEVDPPLVDQIADLAHQTMFGFWQIHTSGGVDVSDPEAVGPPELHVWSRFPDAPDDPVVNQALIAYATDGFLIGTAMRPHKGVGQSQAHKTVATTVLSHTLTFHEAVDASQWNLLAQESPYAGRGRSYGRGNIFDAGGGLVASFVQENMIRGMPKG